MKIVQLLPNLDIGGLERLAVDLAITQKAQGDEPVIFCTSHPGKLAPEVESAGIEIRAFGKTAGFSPRLVYDLAKALRVLRPDVLHAHNALVLHYGVAAARLARVPVVINTRHGGNMNWDPHCERIWRNTVPWADAVVFISDGVKEFYVTRDRLSSRNIHVIYNGINLDKFSHKRARPGGNLTRFRFGAVGRLVPAKDHVSLVQAFAEIALKLPAAELHILGDGPCRGAIAERAASLGVADRVVLHGVSSDVAGFLETLDTFVLSSLDEGLPISIMEAMAAGLPVISTDLPGLPELAPRHVVAGYCPPAKPSLLADLMLQTALRQDLAEMGETARRFASKFGIDATWRKYRGLIETSLPLKRPLKERSLRNA